MKNLDDIKTIISNVKFSNWEFMVNEKNSVPYLQIQFIGACNDSGKVEKQYCRKWQLSYYMTNSELVRTAYKAVLAAVEHEASENFFYKSERIFNPHVDVEALVQVSKCGSIDVRTKD
jgi:hypothetical protein